MSKQSGTFDRRKVLAAGAALAASACVPVQQSFPGRVAARLRLIEASANGTLGVSFLNTASGSSAGYSGYSRFPLCSTFKLSLAAFLMERGQAGAVDPGERVRWTRDQLLSVSPFTTERLGEGASLLELAEAAQKTSDNTAANLLLARLGGPAALTGFWRDIGDTTSRLDRTEPELNNVPPGEIRDTTTAAAMARTLGALLYGDTLTPANRAMLRSWATDTDTGLSRVRAGLPGEWVAGDKTGTSLWPGMGSVYADIGFVEAPGRTPIAFAAYFRAAQQHLRVRDDAVAVLAEVGRVLARYTTDGG